MALLEPLGQPYEFRRRCPEIGDLAGSSVRRRSAHPLAFASQVRRKMESGLGECRKGLSSVFSLPLAMESTGVYWIAPHEVLETAGLEILLGGHAATGASSRRGQEDRPHRL